MIHILKSDMIVAAMEELSDAVSNFNIPSKESLENATIEITVACNPIATNIQSENQPISSFNEQK